MKQNYLFALFTFLLFIMLTSSHIRYPHFYDLVDDEITSLYLKNKEKKEVSTHISIIDIDAYSLQMLGQWPFPRNIISQSLINLTNAGAGIIGLDIVFSSPDRLSPHAIASRINVEGNFTNNDILLANTLEQTPVILGYLFDMSKDANSSRPKHLANIILHNNQQLKHFNTAHSLIDNLPVLKNAAYSSGFFNLTNISNGIVDSAPLLINFDNTLYPSLVSEMLRISSSSTDIHVTNTIQGVEGIQIGNMVIPSSLNAEIKLNFRGPGFSYKYISFYDIYTNNFHKKDIEGKFIFVGTSDIALNDLVSTLYDSAMPGVEVHATTLDNILNGDFFYTPLNHYVYSSLFIILTTLILGTLLYFLPATYTFFAFFSILVLLIGLNYYLIFHLHIIVGLSSALLGLFFTTGFYTLVAYYYENIQKRKIFSKLSSKVSKNVANELLKHDQELLNIEKKNVTVLFSDIRNFTSLSEKIQKPELLIEILNTYMSPMVDCITEYNGTVDKFIGDSIMAYWNAPLEQEAHADMAVQSSLAQLKKLKNLNVQLLRDYNIELRIGIGINSGEVIVGEMGSIGRSDYTLIGDTVNIASRVESLTKKYKYELLITQATKDLLKNTYTIEKVDTLQIRGKTQLTTIYRVV